LEDPLVDLFVAAHPLEGFPFFWLIVP